MRSVGGLGGIAAALLAGAALAVAAQAAPAPRVRMIEIANLAFGPAPPGLKVGDTIEWVNKDVFRHSATTKDNSFDVDLAPSAKARRRLKGAGAIAFFCRYHPGMTGTLMVAK